MPLLLIGTAAFVFMALAVVLLFLSNSSYFRRWVLAVAALVNGLTVIVIAVTLSRPAQDPEVAAVRSYLRLQSDTSSLYWVVVERANTYTCPSTECGVSGTVSFRKPVTVFEESGEWAKISVSRKALCVNGRTRLILEGDNRCDPSNGIDGGVFSEWILTRNISESMPSSGSAEIDEFEALVSGSDDFQLYRDAFAQVAIDLVRSGLCTKDELGEQGGFSSVTEPTGEKLYFSYCGGDTMNDRVFVDAKRKKSFR